MLLPLALSFVAFSTTSFAGGNPDAFAKAIADASHMPIIIEQSKANTLPAVQYDLADRDGLYRTMKTTPIKLHAGGDLVFGDNQLVANHFATLIAAAPSPAKGSGDLPADIVKDGKVTIDTSKTGPILLSTLAKAKFSKPLLSFWLYQDLTISAVATDVPEKTFLTLLAKAVGGYLTSEDQTYTISPDPTELRLRILATIAPPKPVSGDASASTDPSGAPSTQQLKATYYSSIIQNMSDTDLTTLFRKEGNTVTLPIAAGSPIADGSIKYIQGVAAQEAAQQNQNTQRVATGLLRRVDNRRMPTFSIGTSGDVQLTVPVVQGGPGGRRGGAGGGSTVSL